MHSYLGGGGGLVIQSLCLKTRTFNSLHAGKLCMLLSFIDFLKTYVKNTMKVSNGLIQIKYNVLSALFYGRTLCKGYQQKTLEC